MAKKVAVTETSLAFTPMVIQVNRGWLATDSDGGLWWYKTRPEFINGYWYSGRQKSRNLLCYSKKKIGNRASEASLVKIAKPLTLELRPVGDIAAGIKRLREPVKVFSDAFRAAEIECNQLRNDLGNK